MLKTSDYQDKADAIRYQFTAYLKKAVEHKRRDYIERESRYRTDITLIDFQDATALSVLGTAWALCPELSDIETGNDRLERALSNLNNRELWLLYARVIGGVDYTQLARKMNLSVNGAYSAYHRVMVKLRKEMEG